MNTTTNTRGVSEAMVDGPALLQIARDVGLREVMFNVSAERAIPLLQAFFSAALEAALSAPEPAAQGEAKPLSVWLVQDWKWCPKCGGRWGVTDQCECCSFNAAYTATPAQPAERVPVPRLMRKEDGPDYVKPEVQAAWRDGWNSARTWVLTASHAPSEGGKGVAGKEGMVLVPREPTEAQLNQAIAIKKHIAQTGLHHIGKAWATEIYEAMVANAECDCQNEPRGLVSNECPVHNLVPRPKPPGADEQLTASPAPSESEGGKGDADRIDWMESNARSVSFGKAPQQGYWVHVQGVGYSGGNNRSLRDAIDAARKAQAAEQAPSTGAAR